MAFFMGSVAVTVGYVSLGVSASTPSSSSRPGSRPASTPAYSAWPFDANEARRRQEETAASLGIQRELALDVAKGASMKLSLIPRGIVLMGSPVGEKQRSNDEAQHNVDIRYSFYMGIWPVTRAQFAAFIADTQYKTDAELSGSSWVWDGTQTKYARVNGASWTAPGFKQADDHPVVCVSHNDASEFCKWLGKKSGKTVRLPTEAQWELACRGGTATAYQWGDDANDGNGWCNGPDQTLKKQLPDPWFVFPWNDGYPFTSPVGKFRPNPFGLYDMHGNVWEFCSDWYGKDYYQKSPAADPEGPTDGILRVVRGGSWYYGSCRSASRHKVEPSYTVSHVGFRVIVLIGDEKK